MNSWAGGPISASLSLWTGYYIVIASRCNVFLCVFNPGANKVFLGQIKVRISNKVKLGCIGSYSWRDDFRQFRQFFADLSTKFRMKIVDQPKFRIHLVYWLVWFVFEKKNRKKNAPVKNRWNSAIGWSHRMRRYRTLRTYVLLLLLIYKKVMKTKMLPTV